MLGADWTEGIVLPYGAFYGRGTSMAPGSEQLEMIRKRKFPVVGDGGGVWSFVHIADASEATVATVENGGRGVCNIVGDDPAPVAEWLPELAAMLGAKKPMRVPRFVGRLAAGPAGVVLMTELRGASNAKATGTIGRPLVEALLAEGVEVRAVSRVLDAVLRAGAEGVAPEAIRAALKGVRGLFVHPRAAKDGQGPFVGFAEAMIHERDVAGVIVRALMARCERETRRPPTVTHEVDKILGRRTRTFATWVGDHRGAWS
ncbi:hypothetical protein ACQPZP_24975 [Spirillospora sp. CA-142024]|uniref:hypothetical protein n=1 Tax=Spirillospora sp. CA-142024 TaxID=3240036 RepID=UPI003D8EB5E7